MDVLIFLSISNAILLSSSPLRRISFFLSCFLKPEAFRTWKGSIVLPLLSSNAIIRPTFHHLIRSKNPKPPSELSIFSSFMETGEGCCSTHLIDGDGAFNVSGVENFAKSVKLGECGLNYAVVSIMGPQSSGKSTLINNLFHTNFREMDAFKGRSQTTKGIWMAKCVGIDPCTLVMDLEGTDGRERGEDDTAFERQSSLFALAISDIVLINMWCHDIGREQAANKPLLKTVFQVMMRLFCPRKTTLLFVIRDKTRTPLENLEPVLREDVLRIWDSVPKPEAYMETPISDFFNVEVVALSSYEEKEEQFKEQVASLRQRFFHSIAPGGLAGDRRAVVPSSGFSFSSQQIWKVIKENKDLDLPAHKVMVATVRCEEIANEKFSHLTAKKDWLKLEEAVQSGPVLRFGEKISSILDACLSEYDMEAIYFEEGVRTAKRQELESKLLLLVHPAYQSMLGHVRSRMLDAFKEAFDKALSKGDGFSVATRDCIQSCLSQFDEKCKDATIRQASWDSSKFGDKLRRDIDTHIASVRAEKLSQLNALYEAQLNTALAGPVEVLLETAGDDTWPAIKKLLLRETELAVSGLSSALSGFEIDPETLDKMLTSLADFARNLVEMKAKEESGRVLIHMKERDSDSMPRVWTGKEEIQAITSTAQSASLKTLSIMAVIRLDVNADNIEGILSAAFLDSANSGTTNRSIIDSDSLASSTWKEVPISKTLITPVQCKSLWRQFKTETEYTVKQALAAQEANLRDNSWLPPPWAILAIVVLGFNEFMALLRNPLYSGAVFIAFLMAKAFWIRLDVAGNFRNGALTGLLTLFTKLFPTVMNILKELTGHGHRSLASGPQVNPSLQS